MVIASEAGLADPTARVSNWGAARAVRAVGSRVSRRLPRLINAVPLAADSFAVYAGYWAAGMPNPLLGTTIVLACLVVAGTYSRRLTLSGLDIAPAVAMAVGTGAVITIFIADGRVWPRDLLVPIGAAVGAALVGRFIAYFVVRRLRRSKVLRRRAVVVGADAVGMLLTQQLRDAPGYGLDPVLVIDQPHATVPVAGAPSHGIAVQPITSGLWANLMAMQIDAAVIAFPQLSDSECRSLMFDLERMGIDIFVVPRLWEGCPGSGGQDRIGAVPLMRVRTPMHRNPLRYIKVVTERFVAAVALLLVAPLLVTIALAQKLTSPSSPVLFRQTRVGLEGREFDLLKFRSMTPASEAESRTSWTITGDLRVDALGRFLRASSLDELPQLWNIVRGDMALIGPRPERPHFVEMFSSSIPGYELRHRVPTGLTGWAAVNGLSGDTSIAERARYDNYYITNWSLWFDIKIVLQTVWVLLVKFNVYQSQERRARAQQPVPSAAGQLAPPSVCVFNTRGYRLRRRVFRASGGNLVEVVPDLAMDGRTEDTTMPLTTVAAVVGPPNEETLSRKGS